MRPPKKVLVGPHEYTIKAHKGLSNLAEVDGGCIQGSASIVYDPAQALTMLRDTILHEVLHGIWTQTTLDNLYDDKQEEQICWTLAPRILELLRDNPDLVAWLTEE